MEVRMKKLLCLVLLLILALPQSIVANSNTTKKEILDLKQKISGDLLNNTQLSEKYYKHKLAQQQARLIILTASNYVYTYHRGKRSYKQIKEFVESAYECSFIFNKLGDNHLDIFLMYLRWAEAESGYDANQISSWRKGQKICFTRMNHKGEAIGKCVVIIKNDSKDYGILQINTCNVRSMRISIRNLYKSGVIPFKVRSIRNTDDLLDIKTNLVARSIIESDRKALGWDYKHMSYNSMDFFTKLKWEVNSMKKQDLYDIDLIQKYYHLIPVKNYSHS